MSAWGNRLRQASIMLSPEPSGKPKSVNNKSTVSVFNQASASATQANAPCRLRVRYVSTAWHNKRLVTGSSSTIMIRVGCNKKFCSISKRYTVVTLGRNILWSIKIYWSLQKWIKSKLIDMTNRLTSKKHLIINLKTFITADSNFIIFNRTLNAYWWCQQFMPTKLD